MLFSFSKNEDIVMMCQELDSLRKETLSVPLPQLVLRKMQTRGRDSLPELLHELDNLDKETSRISSDSIINTLDDQLYNWSGFERTIRAKDCVEILDIGSSSRLSDPDIEKLLTYIQLSHDHPIIESALLYISILSLLPDDPRKYTKASLITRYRIATSGFDMYGTLTYEDEFLKNKNDYRHTLSMMKSGDNATQWIMFFMNIIKKSLLDYTEQLQIQKRIFLSNAFLLTPRQVKILSLFSDSNLQLSNRDIRQSIKLSPITIAREMATLVQNEYVIPIGKGRSVRYAKIV